MTVASLVSFLTKNGSEGQGTCSLCTLLQRLEPRSPAVHCLRPPIWRLRRTPASSSLWPRRGWEEPNIANASSEVF